MFVWEPVLFGTRDGVFTTCMINIFGVVLFLRTGFLVVSSQRASPCAHSRFYSRIQSEKLHTLTVFVLERRQRLTEML